MNLASIAEGHPDGSVALVSRGVPTTYGELRRDVGGLRSGLVAQGVAPGDRVAILCANNRLFVVAYLAVLGAGAVAVPLNPQSPPVEIGEQLRTVGAAAAVVGPAAARNFEAVEHGLATVLLSDDVDRSVGRDPTPVVDRQPDDLAVLVFTAGTAGSPKAAMLTHGNLHTNLRQAQAVPGRALTADDVSLGVLPLFHIFGLNVVLGLTLFAGASVVLVERIDPTTTLETVRNHGCTVVAGAPPIWVAWSQLPTATTEDFASVRLALSGAAPLPPAALAAMRDRFGVRIDEGYGLTEASPIVTSSVGDDVAPGSIGRPLPGLSIRLVDEDGEDAPLGDPGEVWVQGPNVFAGYWNDPEATAAVLTADGWLRTGDVAVADEHGALRLVDRQKDLIIVSGFNVYPAEVEEVLRRHPAVEDAAVVGVPHPHSGEAVKAFVVVRKGAAVEEDELIEHCAGRLARYKCPAKILFAAALPVGAGGKLLRRQLRDA